MFHQLEFQGVILEKVTVECEMESFCWHGQVWGDGHSRKRKCCMQRNLEPVCLAWLKWKDQNTQSCTPWTVLAKTLRLPWPVSLCLSLCPQFTYVIGLCNCGIVEAGSSEIHKSGQQSRNSGRIECCSINLKSADHTSRWVGLYVAVLMSNCFFHEKP